MATPRSETAVERAIVELRAAAKLTPDEQQAVCARLRAELADRHGAIDRYFFEEIERLTHGLNVARGVQRELGEVVTRLKAPPWHVARIVGALDTIEGRIAVVVHGGTRRAIAAAPGVSIDDFVAGDEVLLSDRLNVIMGPAPRRPAAGGELGTVERVTSDGRIVLSSRGEEVIVDVAAAIDVRRVTRGDLVQWDRHAWMAFETVEKTAAAHLFIESTPLETFDDIGGLDRQIDEVKQVIRAHIEQPDAARKYQLRPPKSLLLVGPPGTGKTMVARALANWLAALSPSGRSRFMNIAPGSLHSMWYSQSEANYRDVFRAAREASEREPDVPVVMFFDEVDAIGAARGATPWQVDDRVLTAFLTELDGFAPRGQVIVVAATNRATTLDAALLRPGRLGDLRIEVARPRRHAARAILEKHLPADLPYAAADASAARDAVIDATVSRLYAPNADAAVVTITFRDGQRRVIEARELVTGALLAKIASAARARAWARECETGESGLRPADVLEGVDRELQELARLLTPANCRQHLADLPQDVDVVRVEPAQPGPARVHRYLREVS